MTPRRYSHFSIGSVMSAGISREPVKEASGTLVGTGVAVGAGVAVGSGDAVGAGVAVGSGVAVGAGVAVGTETSGEGMEAAGSGVEDGFEIISV